MDSREGSPQRPHKRPRTAAHHHHHGPILPSNKAEAPRVPPGPPTIGAERKVDAPVSVVAGGGDGGKEREKPERVIVKSPSVEARGSHAESERLVQVSDGSRGLEAGK